jgi:hypothetical protein
MLTTEEIAQHFNVGSHGTTYGGNPLATTVALNVVEQINQPAFLARVREASAKIFANLEQARRRLPAAVRQAARQGPADRPADGRRRQGPRPRTYTKIAEKLGLMLLIAGPDVVRLAPALIVSDEQIAEADRIMRAAADESSRPPEALATASLASKGRPTGPILRDRCLSREFHMYVVRPVELDGCRRARDAGSPHPRRECIRCRARARRSPPSSSVRSPRSRPTSTSPAKSPTCSCWKSRPARIVGTAADPRLGRFERHLFRVPQRRDPAGLARPEHQPQRACADPVLGTDRLFAAVRLLLSAANERRPSKRRCCRARACCSRCWRRTASATASSCRWPASPT